MFGLTLPKSFTLKNGLIVLCKEMETHEKVMHEVKRYDLLITIAEKTFSVRIWHPGTKKQTYSNDVFDNCLFYPVKYELPGHAHVYNYDEGSWMVRMIEKMVRKEVKTDDTIDRVEIHYDETLSEIPCSVFITTKEGVKVKIPHTIK